MAATMATAGQSISTLFISCIYIGSCISSCGSALDPKNRRPTTNSNTPKEGLLLARLHSNRKGWWMVLWSRAVVYAEANINSICLRWGFTKRGTREESSQSPLCNQLPIRFFFYLFPSNSLTYLFRFRGADRRTIYVEGNWFAYVFYMQHWAYTPIRCWLLLFDIGSRRGEIQ